MLARSGPSRALSDRPRLLTLLRNSKGAIAIHFAIALPALVGFTALGVEMMTLYVHQKRMQRAADAAAVSAGLTGLSALQREVAAKAVAAENGFEDDALTDVVWTTPPTMGNYQGNSAAQEVIISREYTLGLARLFIGNTITIRARAVSIPGRQSTGCVMALAATGMGITVNNGGSIANASCEVVAKSPSDNSLIMWNGSSITGPVYTSGGITLAGSVSAITDVISGRPIVTYGPAVDNPYALVTLPTAPSAPSGCSSQTDKTGDLKKGVTLLKPSRFCDGLVIPNNAKVTFESGIYYIDTKFTVGQQSTITATSGVTFIINTTSTVTVGSGVEWQQNGPASGSLFGLAIASAPGVTGSVQIDNNASLIIEGAIYLPSKNISFGGNARTSGANCTQLIANAITVSGTLSFAANCSAINVKPIGRTQPVLSE